VLGAWILGWVLLWRVPRVPRSGTQGRVGPVTVVVPARNEAARLPRLLEALTPGLGADTRIVVVDDHSEDGTARVAARFPGVHVLAAAELPSGWLGKPWACQQGAAVALPGELVFLDADVRLTADALAAAVAERRRAGGLLSIWPYQERERPYERLSALFHVVTLMALGTASLWPPRRMRGALGPVLLTTTEDYARVGGHAAVREAIVEDIAVGRRYADAGLPVRVLGGSPDITCRMYGEGLPGLLAGWTKSLGSGVTAVSGWRVAGMVAWLTCSVGALTWAGGLPKPAAIVLACLFVAQLTLMFRQVGRFGLLDALVYPLHVLVVVVVLVRGLFLARIRRRVAWRGRSYSPAG
jgi:4,4'-diaponeurosporenoate glycosyltransferase